MSFTSWVFANSHSSWTSATDVFHRARSKRTAIIPRTLCAECPVEQAGYINAKSFALEIRNVAPHSITFPQIKEQLVNAHSERSGRTDACGEGADASTTTSEGFLEIFAR